MRRLLFGCLVGSALCLGQAPLAILDGMPPFPRQNPPTRAKVELGKKLFFDNRLSGPGNRSCGTCHRPELMFSDGLSRAWGLKETELRRRTPTLHNVGWQLRLFHDARTGSLEEQAPMPLLAENEMDLKPEAAVERLRRDSEYQRLFQAAFPGRELSFDLVAEAIASFQRTLVSYDSDLDRYLAGAPEALSESAKRGMALFTEAGCVNCHNGPLLTDQKLHYVGVPEMIGDSPQGTPYKTPSLRDVARHRLLPGNRRRRRRPRRGAPHQLEPPAKSRPDRFLAGAERTHPFGGPALKPWKPSSSTGPAPARGRVAGTGDRVVYSA